MAIKRTRTELELQFFGSGWRAQNKQAPGDAGAPPFRRMAESIFRNHGTAAEEDEEAVGELVVHAEPDNVLVERDVAPRHEGRRYRVEIAVTGEADIKIVG